MRGVAVSGLVLSTLTVTCSDGTGPDFTLSGLAGVYQLESVNGDPIPYSVQSGLEITGGSIELRADTTFLKIVNSNVPVGGFGDVSTWQGDITLIEPDTILFEPSTMAFVPAALVEEFRGTIVGDGLTVVESRSGLPDAGLRALYRRQ